MGGVSGRLTHTNPIPSRGPQYRRKDHAYDRSITGHTRNFILGGAGNDRHTGNFNLNFLREEKMGGVGSGNTRTDYRRGRHPKDAAETKANRDRVSFTVRIEPELLTKFRVIGLENRVSANTMIVEFIQKVVNKKNK